ncbi:uncharacterized protein LOC132054386 [Lycium ferocissimum]|uniref:uncharacterized protein LOC132054386 n=1 Tax=Lycium ferocissimum TaxID=112874 RepID=UPI002814EF9D|nr:uncharacterized protein LOC132054386 [Lycium ferocissimum]
MRIRKHAKISPLIYAAESGKVLLSRVCQLNQSPWDVITFPIEENDDPQIPFLSQPPCSSNYYQVDGFADNNGTFDDSNGIVESATAMKVDEMKEMINCSKWDNYFESSVAVDISVNVKKIKQDKDEDAKMEELGLSMDENNNADNNTAILCNSTNKKQEKQHEAVVAVVETESPRRRPRAKKSSSSSSSSNPYEYYYYSGFGPSWGKKRGARRNNYAMPDRQDAGQYSSSQMDNEELDYVEDEDDEEEENGKKRPQKPIKARTLKSLM